jgi:arylsulfatase A-like enzyme
MISIFSTPLRLFLGLFCFLSVSCHAETTAGSAPNVLFIAVDDLNDWIGALNGHPDTRTPNIDRLAARGILFSNAHCQAPICNPSRTSLLFGTRPSTNGFYNNHPTPSESKAFTQRYTSLSRHFEKNGYRTFTTGKLHHASQLPEDDFMVVGPRPGQWVDEDEKVQVDRPEHMHWLWDFGPQTYDEELFADYIDASWIIDRLGEAHDKPFFMSLGFYRPHVPFFSPERLYNAEDLADGVALPLVKEGDLDDISAYAQEIYYMPYPASMEWARAEDNKKWKEIVRSYLACIRWTDEQLGRVLDALDRSAHADNTIIVLFSDHGFHLGEKDRFAKWTLWERATRVPLIISVPDGLAGAVSTRPVELLSLYPTLIDLCGLSPNPDIEGVSLLPLLEDPAAQWEHPAITTLYQNNHSVRTEDWRYIRYANGDEELYDHRVDANEWTNLAGQPGYTEELARLRALLPQKNVIPYEKELP